jgi:hypothetical protein
MGPPARGSGAVAGDDTRGTVATVTRPRLTTLAVAAGLVVGALAAAALIGSGRLDDRATAAPAKPATADFLAAFQRSLTGTYVVNGTYTRTIECLPTQSRCVNGQTLRSGALVVQRPPDHLRRENGQVDGAINGHLIACTLESNGQFHCGPTATTESFPKSVATQMAALGGYFKGKVPLYRVVHAGDHCFELTQVGEYPSAPYGTFARMCFDPATGALVTVKRSLEGATDLFQATHIRGRVDDSDFAITPDPAFDSHYDTKPGG